ncbi:MAG TPA: hypothetical protein VEY50_00865 [Lysobacter sp.]|nr:hypothetical protein [Lysobacter sp.]
MQSLHVPTGRALGWSVAIRALAAAALLVLGWQARAGDLIDAPTASAPAAAQGAGTGSSRAENRRE